MSVWSKRSGPKATPHGGSERSTFRQTAGAKRSKPSRALRYEKAFWWLLEMSMFSGLLRATPRNRSPPPYSLLFCSAGSSLPSRQEPPGGLEPPPRPSTSSPSPRRM
eukprot:11157645-Alexandrium_andersonii.AAC.1